MKPTTPVEILEEVKRRILAEPKQFVMHTYFASSYRNEVPYFHLQESENEWCEKMMPKDRTIPNCGTAACIAGHILCIREEDKPSEVQLKAGYFIEHKCAEFLGIPQPYCTRLFNLESWEAEYRKRFKEAPIGSLERAQAACDQIDYWIKWMKSRGAIK